MDTHSSNASRENTTRKRRSKATFAAVLGVAALLGSVGSAAADGYWKDIQNRGVLRCGAAIAPPYSMKDLKTGEYGGLDLELCRQFGEQVLKVKVEFVDTTWDNIVAGLQAGKWDISPGLNRTPARALAVSFSAAIGYDEMNFAYLSANGKFTTVAEDLSTFDQPDVRVGVMSGSAEDRKATERFKKATIVRLPDGNGLSLALLSGRIDVAGSTALNNVLLQTANGDKVKVVEPKPALMKQGISFAVPATVSPHDIDVLNVFLEEKIALGENDELLRHWSQVALADAK
jgi:polar amino acid transport system substrate-binding protein